MWSVFYRNYQGEQRVVNWIGDYARFVVGGRESAIAMAKHCFGNVDILAVIHWREPQLPPSPFSVIP